jgi:hypothetical protein
VENGVFCRDANETELLFPHLTRVRTSNTLWQMKTSGISPLFAFVTTRVPSQRLP